MTGDDKWLYFNMHDLVRMRVEARHPSEHSIRLVFDPFRVDSLEDADLTLRSDVPRIGDHSIAGQSYLFTDRQVFLRDYQLHLVRDGDRFVMASTRDLLPYVVPVIQWLLLQRECSLVHGAAVAIEGRGVLLPGWGGTGKTSGIVCLLRDMPGAAFLGDDYTIVTSDGRLLAFPKALFIYPYHHRLFPHVFKARHKPLVPPAFSGVLEYVRTAVRPTIMAFPALERIARRITPEHMQVPARKALPDAEFADSAAGACLVHRTTLRYRDASPRAGRGRGQAAFDGELSLRDRQERSGSVSGSGGHKRVGYGGVLLENGLRARVRAEEPGSLPHAHRVDDTYGDG